MTRPLSIRSLSAGYVRGNPVVQDVSLDVSPGEILGIVGPNGSGKTTLVRAATRVLRPEAGQVMLEGHDIQKMSTRDIARRVAVVPQDTVVPFDLTSLQTVLLGRHPHVGQLHLEDAHDADLAVAALASVGARHLANQSIRRISGGERQRVLIAKALAQEPSILFLDEPTAHLDVSHQAEVLSLVSSLARDRGMSVVTVLHDLNLAAAWCERLAVMHDGKLAALGPPAEVLTEALIMRVWNARMWVRRHPLTGRPFLLPVPPPYEADSRDESVPMRVHVICGGGSGGPIISALMAEGCEITCGVVNVGDSDEELCRMMNIPHVAEAPFSPISTEREAANERLASEADAVVVTPFCVGPGNLANLRTAVKLAGSGQPLVLLVSEGQEDYTDGEGGRLLEQLSGLARQASTEAEALEALRSAAHQAEAGAPEGGSPGNPRQPR